MKRILLLLAVGLCLVNCGYAAETILSAESYGDVVFGNKITAIEQKLGEVAEPKVRQKACDFVNFRRYPKVKFMVEEGIVTRADAEAGVQNVLGISVGTSLADVKRRYPGVQVKLHKYVEDGHYLVFPSGNGKEAIVMEEVGGKVTRIRAGVEPSVEYVEGCL